MNKLPKTHWIGCTVVDEVALAQYLSDTEQGDFSGEWCEASELGAMRLCSFYAKLCYKSLVLGKNANVKKIREIEDNLKSIITTGHGSVLEHVVLNFVTTDCSRVFTHELVRHRVGTAFSQTSGRYVSIDELDMVLSPELADSKHERHVCWSCKDVGGLSMCDVCGGYGTLEALQVALQEDIVEKLRIMRKMLIRDDDSFTTKKRYTSSIRRWAPNGQTNEIGWSANIRSLRHMIEMRTSFAAEWEIRQVFGQVAAMLEERAPMLLWGGEKSTELVDGVSQWTKLKV